MWVGAEKFWLTCRQCRWTRPAGSLDYLCGRCGGQLTVEYATPYRGPYPGRGMWRFRDRLPVGEGVPPVTLSEGDTPLVPLPVIGRGLGVRSLRLKSEYLNPTGSFKDRISSVALSIVVERGLAGCIGTSSGNGGASVSAYGVRAGKPVYLFVLPEVADVKLAQIRAIGGQVWTVPDLGEDADAVEQVALTIGKTASDHGWFPILTGGRFSPEAMEGTKTIAFELAEEAPDATVVYAPVGGGGLFASMWRGYLEARDTLPAGPPRLVAVQPRGSATLREALAGRAGKLPGPITTAVSGLQVPVLFDDEAVLAVTAEGSALREVTDEQIWAAQRRLAHEEGLLLEAAGATALAGALADAGAGKLGPDDRVVVIGTGSGIKDSDGLRRLAAGSVVQATDSDGIPGLLASDKR